jgi:hypothetical integral membrane protein (TIGR02206 family)
MATQQTGIEGEDARPAVIAVFDVRPGREVLSPMFGRAHLASMGVFFGLALLMIAARSRLRRVPLDGRAVRGLAWFILLDQVFLFVLYFAYDYQPFWERFPLHLCAGLSFFIPIAMLLGRIDLVRFVGTWAMGAGLISVVNMSITRHPAASYVFVHYFWMHAYLFAVPLFLTLRGEMRLGYGAFARSLLVLFALAALVFGLDWATGANYMYLGPGSELDVPLLPEAWRAWPWSFPTFAAVGVGLLHGMYAVIRRLERSGGVPPRHARARVRERCRRSR